MGSPAHHQSEFGLINCQPYKTPFCPIDFPLNIIDPPERQSQERAGRNPERDCRKGAHRRGGAGELANINVRPCCSSAVWSSLRTFVSSILNGRPSLPAPWRHISHPAVLAWPFGHVMHHMSWSQPWWSGHQLDHNRNKTGSTRPRPRISALCVETKVLFQPLETQRFVIIHNSSLPAR